MKNILRKLHINPLLAALTFAFFSFTLVSCNSEGSDGVNLEMKILSIADSLASKPLTTPLALEIEAPEGKAIPPGLAALSRDANLWESHIVTLHGEPSFDSSAMNAFSELARETKGEMKLLADSKFIADEIAKVVEKTCGKGTDLLLMIDKTGSMSDDIENVKAGLDQIIGTLSKKDNLRLAVAVYGDKEIDGPDWLSFQNFEKNYKKADAFIRDIYLTGGGDWPESVYEGFFESLEQDFWRSDSKRIVLIVGDAPPKIAPDGKYSLADVVAKSREGKIAMNFYPIVVSIPTGIYGAGEPVLHPEARMISSVYPSPTNGPLNIKFSWSDEYAVEIFGINGAMEMTAKISGETGELDVSALPDGAYFIRVFTSAGDYETRKFVVVH